MKTIKDVKEIHDIPNIENLLGKYFHFNCYCKGDSMLIYEYQDDDVKIVIDMHTQEDTFFNVMKLEDIITFDRIGYLCFTILNHDEEVIDQYDYRPLVDDKEKDFNWTSL